MAEKRKADGNDDRSAKRRRTLSESFFNTVITPKTLQEFVTSFEKTEPLIINRHSPNHFKNFPTIKDVEKYFSDRDNDLLVNQDDIIYFKEEDGIQTYNYNDESNTELTFKDGVSLLDDDWNIVFRNSDKHFPEVKNALISFDEFWPGDGGSSIELYYTNKDFSCRLALPYEQFLFQLESKVKVTLYKHTDNTGLDVDNHELSWTSSYGEDESEEFKVACSGELEPGDVAYIPAGCPFLISYDTARALTVSLQFRSPTNWLDYLNQILVLAQDNSKVEESPRVISDIFNDGQEHAIMSKVQSVLTKSQELSKTELSKFLLRSKFKKYDYEVSAEWIKTKLDGCSTISDLVKKNNGMVEIPDFLPVEVAHKIRQTLEVLRDDEWEESEAQDSYSTQDAQHRFLIGSKFPNNKFIFNIFKQLEQGKPSQISAARYNKGHHITEHDDKYHTILGGSTHTRKTAILYYLSPDWKEEYGGLFIDKEGLDKDAEPDEDLKDPSRIRVPKFNSLVAFSVPRRHRVTEVLVDNPVRYSIFGWFLGVTTGSDEGKNSDEAKSEEESEED